MSSCAKIFFFAFCCWPFSSHVLLDIRLEKFRARAAHGRASKFPSSAVILTKIDGGRCVACWFGSCHTLRRMSGAWCVRVGWILA